MKKKVVWLAIHRQTKERRILLEEDAFELDKREWRLETWNCTSGNESPGINKETPLFTPRYLAPLGIKCLECGSYACTAKLCTSPNHVRFYKRQFGN